MHQISVDLANSVLSHYKKTGVVVPPQALKNVFCVGGLDNIDVNTRSTTCRSNLHGTLITLIQFPLNDNTVPPAITSIMNPEEMGKSRVDNLPPSYYTMKHIYLPDKDIYVPDLHVNSYLKPYAPDLENTLSDAYAWLDHAKLLLSKENLDVQDWISWGAYNASQLSPPQTPITQCMALPIFREPAHSPMMIYHGMNIIKSATEYLNPGQVPVMVCDLPLYVLAKKIQWK